MCCGHIFSHCPHPTQSPAFPDCSEVFNRFSGDNFKNYLNRYRINMAQKILTEDPDVRIAELASRVGFSSSNTFIRVFDRYMGVTPKQYADSVREKN